jgi:hypothetical protein
LVTQQPPALFLEILQLLLHCPASQCNARAAQNQLVLRVGLWLLCITKGLQHARSCISYSNCKGNIAHATIAAINLLPLLLQPWWHCMPELVHKPQAVCCCQLHVDVVEKVDHAALISA